MRHTDLVIVGNQPRVVTDAGLVYVRAAVSSLGVVAWTGQHAASSAPIHVRGVGAGWVGPSAVFGTQSVGIVPKGDGWQVTWVESPWVARRVNLDANLAPTGPVGVLSIPEGHGGQGFLDVAVDATPVWVGLHRTVTLGGHTLFLPMRRGDWTLGQDGQANRLLIYRHSTAEMFVAFNGYTPVASRLAVDAAGEPWVLPAGSMEPIGRSRFEPWTPVYAPVVPIGRPLWMGWFEFAHVNPGVLPSNCRVPVTQGARYLDVQGPGWAYVSGDPDGDLPAIERAIADVSGLAPVVAYVPRRAQHGLPTSAELQGVECYIGADETDAQFVARIEAALRKSPRAVLIAQCYTSNHTLTADLRRVPGLVSRLARDHRNVEGILVFSGSGRATGWQDHPEVHAAWRQVFAGITGTPALDPPRPPAPTKPEPKPEPPPASPDLADRLRRFQTMYRGEALRSPDGRTVLTFQGDGNLVLTRDGAWRWHSGTHGLDAEVLEMQGDGHLVLSDEDGAAIWGSGTHGHPGAELRVLDDGTAVIVSPTGEVLWQAPRAEPTPAPEPAPTPDPSPEPERPVSRKPNVKKALLDFLRGIAAVFGAGPKPQRRPPMEWPLPVEPPPVSEPPLPAIPEPARGRTGRVRLEGHAFADDGGPWNVLDCSLFWALWGERHDPDRLDQNLGHVAAHGADSVRILAMVGAASWEDRVIDPRWPDYWDVAARLFDRLKRHGLRAHLTLFADAQVMMPSQADRDAFQRAWLASANGRADQFLLIQTANEYWQNGLALDELRRRGAALRAGTSIPVALSDPGAGHAVFPVYGGWPGVAVLHYDRDVSKADGAWRPHRQPWGWPLEYREIEGYHGEIPPVAMNGEPIGPWSSVASETDPLRLALSYVTTFVSGNAGYTFHCGAGVRGGGAFDIARGRPANLYDVDHTILRAIGHWRRTLPSGLANWTRHNAQWASMPWDGSQRAVDRGDIMRAYAATSGRALVGVFLNVKRPHAITPRQPLDLTLYHPVTAEVVARASLATGQTWTVPAGLPGYVVIGEMR